MSKDNTGFYSYFLSILALAISAIYGVPIYIYGLIALPFLLILYIYVYLPWSFRRSQKTRKIETNLDVAIEKKENKVDWKYLTYEERLNNFVEKSQIWKDLTFNIQMEFYKEKKWKENLAKSEQIRKDIELKKQEELRLKRIQFEEDEKVRLDKELQEQELKKIEDKKRKREESIKKLDDLKKQNIKNKILAEEKKRMLESEAINELIREGLINTNYGQKNTRESIPTHIKVFVWNRDRQCCISCNSKSDLEFDHIIPVSKGGANSINNIQLLCRNCNRKKYNKII